MSGPANVDVETGKHAPSAIVRRVSWRPAERGERTDLWRNAVAGLSGGFVSSMAMHPLDVVSTRLQVCAPVNRGTFLMCMSWNKEFAPPMFFAHV